VPALQVAAGLDDDGRSLVLRRLWSAWFTVVWEGLLPSPGDAGDLRWTPEGRFAFLGDASWVPASLRSPLRAYLCALADGDGAAAAAVLVAALDAPEAATALERRLRLASGFRETAWTGAEGLPGEMLAHGRILAATGVAPPPPFGAFFPALAATAAQAARLAPEHGEAAEALYRVRLTTGLDALRGAFDPRRLPTVALRQALLASELPEKLDRALSRLADGDLRLRLTTQDGGAAPRQPADAPGVVGVWPLAVSCALVLAGVALALPFLTSRLGGWGEVVAALLLLVVGGLMLMPPRRRRRKERETP